MSATAQPSTQSALPVAVLGVIAFLVILAVLTGKNVDLPLISEGRGAFFILFLVGFAMCTLGGVGHVSPGPGALLHNVIGGVLGVLLLLLGAAVLFNVKASFIPDERGSFVLLALLMTAKLVTTNLPGVLLSLGVG
jgi:hypothetical protein